MNLTQIYFKLSFLAGPSRPSETLHQTGAPPR